MTTHPYNASLEEAQALANGASVLRVPVTPQPVEVIDTGSQFQWRWTPGYDAYMRTDGDLIDHLLRNSPYKPGDTIAVRSAYDPAIVYVKPLDWLFGKNRYGAGTDGNVYRMLRSTGEWKLLQGTPSSRGYATVTLCDGVGNRKTAACHRLVAEAFYGPPESGDFEVRHIDGDKSNNSPHNIDWGTRADNSKDFCHHQDRGVGHQPRAKLTRDEAEQVRSAVGSQRAIARRFGVSQATVWRIRSSTGWQEQAEHPRNTPAWCPWTSASTMPEWAIRTRLRVKSVRVEQMDTLTPREMGEWLGIKAGTVVEAEHVDALMDGVRIHWNARLTDDGKPYGETEYAFERNPWTYVYELEADDG